MGSMETLGTLKDLDKGLKRIIMNQKEVVEIKGGKLWTGQGETAKQ